MTERTPPGVGFESWIDQQIPEAEERGDFATLPGGGNPIPEGLDTASHDTFIVLKKNGTWHLTLFKSTSSTE